MNRTRNTVLTILFLSLSISSFAQFGVPNLLKYDRQRFHFGFLFGYNRFDFKITSKPDLSEYDPLKAINTENVSGASLGIVTNLRLGKYFDLRFIPGFSYGGHYVSYYIGDDYECKTMSVESVFLDFPLLINFKSTRMLNNIRAYVIAGGQYSYDALSNKHNSNSSSQSGKVVLKFNPHDVQAQVGVGFDFYCTYFKFSTELKMSFGFLNMLVPEDNMYATSVSSLKSKNLQISFTFE